MRLTRRGGICQPIRQLKGSGHDRHDEAHAQHSSTGRVGNSGAWRGIVGAAPRSSDVLARTHSSRGGPGGGQGPCVEPYAVHRPGTEACRRPDENEVEPSDATAIHRRRLRVAADERHPGHAFAPLHRIGLDRLGPAAGVEIGPLSWEGDVGAMSPSHQGAPRERLQIGVTCSGSSLLEPGRFTADDPRNAVLSVRRVTFRVTSVFHHPLQGRVSTWG
jgi:hypothetical protein